MNDFSNDWWRGAVIYQIYPRSYKDSNADGVGDIKGIIEKLDYIADLGVDAIWLSPFYTSPMKDFGYDIADYCDVDPLFGCLADFVELIDTAHKKNIKVLIDLVLSHTSDQHPWFVESRQNRDNDKTDWYVWADAKNDGSPPNNWLSIFGGSAWQWESRRKQYYQHNFLKSQPDLNYHNPAVRKAVLAVAKFWLDQGVDGFRLDTANMYYCDAQLRNNPTIDSHSETGTGGVPKTNPFGMQSHIYNINRPETLIFMESLRKLMNQYEGITSIGELGVAQDIGQTTKDYTRPNRLHMAYNFELLDTTFSAQWIKENAQQVPADGSSWRNWAMSNHDVVRVMSRWNLEQHPEAAPMLIAINTTLLGSACLYQGEELGLPEASVPLEHLQDPYGKTFWPEFKGRDGCRTPMPWNTDKHAGFSCAEKTWLPVPDLHRSLAVSEQLTHQHSTLNRVKRFLHWRKTQVPLRIGLIDFIDDDNPDILTYVRKTSNAAILCVFNCSNHTSTLSIKKGSELVTQNGFEHCATLHGNQLSLKKWGAAFLYISTK